MCNKECCRQQQSSSQSGTSDIRDTRNSRRCCAMSCVRTPAAHCPTLSTFHTTDIVAKDVLYSSTNSRAVPSLWRNHFHQVDYRIGNSKNVLYAKCDGQLYSIDEKDKFIACLTTELNLLSKMPSAVNAAFMCKVQIVNQSFLTYRALETWFVPLFWRDPSRCNVCLLRWYQEMTEGAVLNSRHMI